MEAGSEALCAGPRIGEWHFLAWSGRTLDSEPRDSCLGLLFKRNQEGMK